MNARPFVSCTLFALALFACQTDDDPSATTATTTTTQSPSTGGSGGDPGSGGGGAASGGGGAASAEPSVEMTVDPDVMSAGETITATVTVANLILEAPMNQGNVDGHGHYHIYLDGNTGINYLVAGETPTIQVTIPPNILPGDHTLRVSLGENNHTPLSPPVEDIVPITVE